MRQEGSCQLSGRRPFRQAWQYHQQSLPNHVSSALSVIFFSIVILGVQPVFSLHKFTRFTHAYLPSPSYLDLYLSTVQGPASFFGNRSLVVHSNNATRLTCANFTLIAGNSTITGGTAPVPTSTQPAYTGGAATRLVSAGAVVAGLVACVL